jgi:hypothetical protein
VKDLMRFTMGDGVLDTQGYAPQGRPGPSRVKLDTLTERRSLPFYP